MFTCTMAWITVLILLPAVIILWATESRKQRCKRLKGRGWIQKDIAKRLKVSPSTVSRDLQAA